MVGRIIQLMVAHSMDLHGAFDNGFFTIQVDYSIKVHEENIQLPNDSALWSSQEMLESH
jgi:hypothetical protein